MKKPSIIIALSLIISAANAQDNLVFKGTVKCYIADNPNATQGAKNVVVVPGVIPVKAGITGQQGYYEVNTGISAQKLEGKYVIVYFVSACQTCEQKKNVFVSADQLKAAANKKDKLLTIETLQMLAPCKRTELKQFQSDSVYNAFIKYPAQDLDKIGAQNVVTATPGFLNLLTSIVPVVAVGGGSSDASVTNVLPGKIRYGRFLLSSPMSNSGNTGFNFAPSRDLSEAVFWNPSALANSNQNGGIAIFSNLKNNHKLSFFGKINERFSIGAGGIYTKQDELRPTVYQQLSDPALHLRNLEEYAVYITPVMQVTNDFSVAVAGKSIWQNFNRPAKVVVPQQPAPLTNTFIDSNASLQKFDVDVSFSYVFTPAFKIGLNVMNLAGTTLLADALPAKIKSVPVQKLRSFGLGLLYKYKQFNFGADVLITENDLYDVSLGVNYIPFNNALFSAGFAFKQKSFSLSYRMKYFKIAYVNDNGFLVNNSRTAKSSIFNGYIYSGLVFDL